MFVTLHKQLHCTQLLKMCFWIFTSTRCYLITCGYKGGVWNLPKGPLSNSGLLLILCNLGAEREVDWRWFDGTTASRMVVVMVGIGVGSVTLRCHDQINSRKTSKTFSKRSLHISTLNSNRPSMNVELRPYCGYIMIEHVTAPNLVANCFGTFSSIASIVLTWVKQPQCLRTRWGATLER